MFGVAENAGVAVAVPGINTTDVDGEIRRLDSIIQSSIEPRIAGVRIRAVRDASAVVLVVRVPRSWWGLHMVSVNHLQRFVARNNAGKYPLDVHQVRAGFLAGAEMADRARLFRDERLQRVRDGETPILLQGDAGIIVHFLPTATFIPAGQIDLQSARGSGLVLPLYPTGADLRFNIDGVLARGDNTYATVYRSGAVETVSTAVIHDPIPSRALAEALIDALTRYLRLCKLIDIAPPVFVLATLFGVRNVQLAVPTELGVGYYAHAIDRDVVYLPDVVIDTLDADVPQALRPMLDGLWQAAGLEGCADYDDQGHWKRRS